MFSQTQSFKNYLKRRERAINAENSKESNVIDLFNENTFYHSLIKDLLAAKKEVIIYSPFVSKHRTDFLKPTIEKLKDRNIDVFIFTRPIEEYEHIIRPQIECALKRYEDLGAFIFYPGRYIHQKVAIIDREILWEGSLNILSHRSSNEMMRRTQDSESAIQVMSYIGINEPIAEAYKTKYEKLYNGLLNKSRQSFKSKMKIFLFGMSVPMFALAIIAIVYSRPLKIIELLINFILKLPHS